MTSLRSRLVAGLVVVGVVVAAGCAPTGGDRAPEPTPAPSVTSAGVPTAPPRATTPPAATAAPTPDIAYGPIALEPTGAGVRAGTIAGPDGTRTFTLHVPEASSR